MGAETVVVHVTHEAAGKIGGIGAVLQGFFTCPSYLQAVSRSILVSPLFAVDGSLEDRLGPGGPRKTENGLRQERLLLQTAEL